MNARALVPAAVTDWGTAFENEGHALSSLREFHSIPEHDHGIVAFRGMVIVYDTSGLFRDGFIEDGAFYVIEHQRTPDTVSFQLWLEREMEGAASRCQPRSSLRISREIVRLERDKNSPDCWIYYHAGGLRDGPIERWAVTFPIIGKVVGIYRPAAGQEETLHG